MYRITHQTHYRYSYPVDVANHVACLRPRELPHQHLLEFDLGITPHPAMFTERTDYFGNTHQIFSIQSPHRELLVRAHSFVEVLKTKPDPSAASIPWESARDHIPEDHSTAGLDAYQFTFESPRIPLDRRYADYARESFTPQRPLHDALLELTTRIHTDFKFKSASTNVSTTVEEVFTKRVGVCQDFAQVQIACLRSLRLAARYVSGYLRTIPPPGKERLVGADASHAWLSVYCPDPGSTSAVWIDVDPTNNCEPSGDHITLAWGRDYSDVSPLRGLILGGGSHALKVAVDVEPVEQPTLA